MNVGVMNVGQLTQIQNRVRICIFTFHCFRYVSGRKQCESGHLGVYVWLKTPLTQFPSRIGCFLKSNFFQVFLVCFRSIECLCVWTPVVEKPWTRFPTTGRSAAGGYFARPAHVNCCPWFPCRLLAFSFWPLFSCRCEPSIPVVPLWCPGHVGYSLLSLSVH